VSVSVPETRRKHANMTFMAFCAVGVAVALLAALLTGSLLLGFAYGLAPGLVLGGLAWLRVARGGLFRVRRKSDSSDPV